jgi:PAS domain S-box-containing protein
MPNGLRDASVWFARGALGRRVWCPARALARLKGYKPVMEAGNLSGAAPQGRRGDTPPGRCIVCGTATGGDNSMPTKEPSAAFGSHTPSRQSTELRQSAEEALESRPIPERLGTTPEEAEEILHELRVHQIELEMQNEELRRAQLSLDAQREKYFYLFDLAPVGYLTLDNDGRVTDANLTAVGLLRVERQVLFGQPFSAFVLSEDRDELYLLYRDLAKSEQPQTRELRLRRAHAKDNSRAGEDYFWARLESRPQRTSGDETHSTWMTFTDITKSKAAEDALVESEDKFKFFFGRSVVPKSITYLNGKVQLNEAFCAMLGYTPQELAEKTTWMGVTHPDDVADTQRQMDLLLSGEKTWVRFEKRYVRKDGEIVWADVSSSLRRDDVGLPLYFMTTVLDITEKRRAAEAALEEVARHKTIVQTAMDGFWLLDSDGILLEVNQAYCKMSGYSEDELVGLHVSDLEVGESPEEIARHIEKVAAQGEDRFESQHRGKDGRLFDVDTSVRYRPSEGGWMAAFFHDITVRKAAERELRANAARLQNLLAEREVNLAQLAGSLSSIIDVVGQVVETRDPYTAGHERRVAELAVRIAQEMGQPAEQVEEVRIASLIHDVGKISVPTEILVKPGKLSAMEFELIKGHSEAGYKILSSVDLKGPTAEIVLQHHERCDGSGYPQGLTEDQLLDGTKIVMVADVLEAMTSHRPYRPALGIGPALAEIERGAGQQYDLAVAEACKRVVDSGFEFSEV